MLKQRPIDKSVYTGLSKDVIQSYRSRVMAGARVADMMAPKWFEKRATSDDPIPAADVDYGAAYTGLTSAGRPVVPFKGYREIDGAAYGFYDDAIYLPNGRDTYDLLEAEWSRIINRRLYLQDLRQRRKLGQTPGTMLKASDPRIRRTPKKARLTAKSGTAPTTPTKETSARTRASRRSAAKLVASTLETGSTAGTR